MRSIVERLAYNRANSRQLNPLLFNDFDELIPQIKQKILDIVDAFIEYIQVDIRIMDIRLVGSNAAYNYGEHSDLDIHIVTDLSDISDPETIARLYFDSVKKNFKDSYDIKIKGIDVELYVEDINASTMSNGIYSVSKDKWIKEPTPSVEPTEEDISAAEQIEEEIIDSILNSDSIEELQDIIDDLYLLRKDSLSSDGETGAGNLAFKSLRNKGVLDKAKDILRSATAKKLSLESKKLSENNSWIGGNPWDDDLFHENAKKLGLTVQQEIISVQGKPLEFDYVILKEPITFYHATTEDRVDSIKAKGLTPQTQAGGRHVSGVFLTGSKEAASKWRSKDNIVLEVVLDRSTKVYQDRQSNAVFVRERIPKENISVL